MKEKPVRDPLSCWEQLEIQNKNNFLESMGQQPKELKLRLDQKEMLVEGDPIFCISLFLPGIC